MSLVLDFLIIVCVDSSHSFPFEFILQVFWLFSIGLVLDFLIIMQIDSFL
jgi:hypothetical protein